MKQEWIHTTLIAAALAVSPAVAGDGAARPKRTGDQQIILSSTSFLSSHPDLRWRLEGMRALDEGQPRRAIAYLKRAARYADKPAQALLAELHWDGTGTPQDRVEGYIWMDLAAERGYLPFLARREAYWRALDETQKAQVQQRGAEALAEFGDAAAKPRLETILRRASRNVAGSRVGFVGPMEIRIPGPGGEWHSVRGDEYYQREYWQPEKYWAWQDALWRDPKEGNVIIRPIERVDSSD